MYAINQSRDLRTLVRDFERRLILHALELHHGHQRRAAASLGIRPTTLHEKMKRLGIHPGTGDFESASDLS
jgi:DNA-binding NtrC family response regulator